jgi:hypothetical protein
VMCSSLSSFLHGMLHMVYNCLIWSAKIQASIWIIFCTLKLMGSFLPDRWRKKQMKWKRELKKTNKRHVLCSVIFSFVSLIYLYCSSHTYGYYTASHNLSVGAYVIHFLQFDLSRWVDILMCWLPVQEEEVNHWEVLGLGAQQWYQTYLGMCTFSELLTKQTWNCK